MAGAQTPPHRAAPDTERRRGIRRGDRSDDVAKASDLLEGFVDGEVGGGAGWDGVLPLAGLVLDGQGVGSIWCLGGEGGKDRKSAKVAGHALREKGAQGQRSARGRNASKAHGKSARALHLAASTVLGGK